MIKITGLDKLQKELQDVQRILGELDGELGTINFDPHNPASIEPAIQSVFQIIDQRAGRYASNSIANSMIEEMKATYRESIVQEAAAARLKSDENK